MRLIEIEEGITIRFPTRSDEFSEGFEAGLIASALTHMPLRHDARVAAGAAAPVSKLARVYGYRVIETPDGDGMVRITLLRADQRPRLTLVQTESLAG